MARIFFNVEDGIQDLAPSVLLFDAILPESRMACAESTEVTTLPGEGPNRTRRTCMSDDDKRKVNIEDLPVPLKELDKEEQENVTGGLVGVNPTISPVRSPVVRNIGDTDAPDTFNP